MFNSFTNRSSDEVLTIVRYNVPALAIIPEYTKAREFTVEDARMLLDGINDGTIRHNTTSMVEITRGRLYALVAVLEDEKRYFAEHGEFREGFQTADEGITIDGIDANIKAMHKGIASIDKYKDELKLTVYPELIKSLVEMSEKKDILDVFRLIQYTGLIKIRGQVLFDMKHIIDKFDLYDLDWSFVRMVLEKFLKFYLDHYEGRKQRFENNKRILIEPEHILLGMDSEMRVVMDVVCPELLVEKNKNSMLNIDIGVVINEESYGFTVYGEHITDVVIPGGNIFQGLFDNVVVSEAPEHTTIIYHESWVREFKALMPLIIKLSTTSFVRNQEFESDLCDKIQILTSAGVRLTEVQSKLLVDTLVGVHKKITNTDLLSGIVYILLSPHGDNLEKYSEKFDFSLDVERMIPLVRQYDVV